MIRSRISRSIQCSLVLLNSLPAALASERVLPREEVPRAVIESSQKQYPSASITRSTEEIENGKQQYELRMKSKDDEFEITYSASGQLISSEKKILWDAVPLAVQKAVLKKYPRATARKIEYLVKADKTSYEITLMKTDNKTLEARFDPLGNFLEEE